jgi:hypothetical protein
VRVHVVARSGYNETMSADGVLDAREASRAVMLRLIAACGIGVLAAVSLVTLGVGTLEFGVRLGFVALGLFLTGAAVAFMRWPASRLERRLDAWLGAEPVHVPPLQTSVPRHRVETTIAVLFGFVLAASGIIVLALNES